MVEKRRIKMAAIMTHQQKYDTLESCWQKYSHTDLTDDSEMERLENGLHHLITAYNASPSESLENSIMVSQFIAMKLREEHELHELNTSPNIYYGV
jgi:hypothetical protein